MALIIKGSITNLLAQYEKVISSFIQIMEIEKRLPGTGRLYKVYGNLGRVLVMHFGEKYIQWVKLFKSGLSISIVLFVIIFSCTSCFLIPKEEEVIAPPLKEPQKITYDYVELKKSTFENKIEVRGQFISAKQKDVCFINQSGRLKAVYVKPGDTVKKGTLIAEIVTDNLESQIALEEIYLKKYHLTYNMNKSLHSNDYVIEQSKLDVDAERIKLDLLKKQLQASKLIAPIDGVVDYIIDTKNGNYIDAYSTVARIADKNDLQVEYTDENVGDFKLGMKVVVEVNQQKFNGKVIMAPGDLPVDANGKLQNTVRIKVDNLPKDVDIGESAYISLLLAKKDNSIVIKKSYLHSLGDRKYVNVLENNIKKERDVETGEENQTEVVIVKGLSEGDKLITD